MFLHQVRAAFPHRHRRYQVAAVRVGTYDDSRGPHTQTDGMRLADRLARLDERVLPARWLQRPPDEAARARNEIKIGLVGLVGSGILAVVTREWGLLAPGCVFLIAGLVRRHSARATERGQT